MRCYLSVLACEIKSSNSFPCNFEQMSVLYQGGFKGAVAGASAGGAEGAAAGAGIMSIVREVVGKGVTGDATPNPAWRG